MMVRKFSLLIIIALLIAGISACSGSPSSTSSAAPTLTPTSAYSQYQLEYLLLSDYPDIFWCDPDYYPIAREGQEQANAIQQFSAIRANNAEFSAILEHLNLPEKTDYTDAEKLSIYREHKKLVHAITMTPSGAVYDFSLRTGQNQGQLIKGAIDSAGKVKIQAQETSFNTCPICLTRGTLIDAPSGAIPVEQLQPGIIVWTVDRSGNRIAAPAIRTSSTLVPPVFEVLRLSLNDGRSVTASPGHPTAELRPLSDYHTGDILDKGIIIKIELIDYIGETYDILPSGETGLYWANGILLKSTLN